MLPKEKCKLSHKAQGFGALKPLEDFQYLLFLLLMLLSTEMLYPLLTQVEPLWQGHPVTGTPTAHCEPLDPLVLPPAP